MRRRLLKCGRSSRSCRSYRIAHKVVDGHNGESRRGGRNIYMP
jgi:hypothetical protein